VVSQKEYVFKNSIYFGRLCHRQELHGTDFKFEERIKGVMGKDRYMGQELFLRCRKEASHHKLLKEA
jgi:hypothetical protein